MSWKSINNSRWMVSQHDKGRVLWNDHAWIEVKEGKWKMRVAVIRFKALSGGHSGENLGRYSVGLLD